MEYREVPHWQKLLERLLEDKEIMAGVHLKFQDLYKEYRAIQRSVESAGNVSR